MALMWRSATGKVDVVPSLCCALGRHQQPKALGLPYQAGILWPALNALFCPPTSPIAPAVSPRRLSTFANRLDQQQQLQQQRQPPAPPPLPASPLVPERLPVPWTRERIVEVRRPPCWGYRLAGLGACALTMPAPKLHAKLAAELAHFQRSLWLSSCRAEASSAACPSAGSPAAH